VVTIVLPAGWTQGERTSFPGTEGPLLEVIQRFASEHPDYRRRLLGPDDQFLTYLNVCINDELILRHQRATISVAAGSTVTVMAPMAGG
jgi:molybdopterin converting factor small subunit